MSASRLRNQVLSIVLLASVLPGVAEVRGSGDYWVSRASAPMSVFLSGATTVGGRVYVMGGLYSLTSSNGRNGQNSPSNVAYDPNSDVWTVLAPMPTVRQQMGVVAVNGKIYAIGGSGYDSPSGISNKTEIYDPSTNSWTTGPVIPDATTAFATAAVGSVIYVIGGDDSKGAVTNVWALNTTGESWTRKSSMPIGLPLLAGSQAVAIGEKIYVSPGNAHRSGSSPGPSLVYDVASDAWLDLWSGPFFQGADGKMVSLYAFGIAALGTKIFIVGGIDANSPRPSGYNFQYDIANGQWVRGKDMPTPRNGLVVESVNGLVYAIGGGGSCGNGGTGSCTTNEAYLPADYQGSTLPSNPAPNNGFLLWAIIGIATGASVIIGLLVFNRRRSGKKLEQSASTYSKPVQ